MRNIWLITDTHFNHNAMIPYCGRPENYTELILENWSKVVQEGDVTIHLGDVIFSKSGTLLQLLSRVKGTKILVRGNHDKEKDNWYMTHGFDFTCDELVKKDVLFSHIPKPKRDGIRLNVHGHFHNTDHRSVEPEISAYYDPEYHKLLAIESKCSKSV